ncbi:MAG: class I SAM-dependent methyltransferase, partial [Alphaproteobacteria bacterium]|nr:class I SAM-dependent methyltransferase [Alphaproteobacteria bacterium]
PRMERCEYDKLDQAEDRMWWFAALHRNLDVLSRRLLLETAGRPVLDAGCGTGGLLARLKKTYPEKTVFGLDLDPRACARAALKGARPVCVGSVNDLPFADSTFAAIFSADVLCHDGVREDAALRQFHRCLVENGWLILSLPAYRWMLSRHDVAVSNIRRYTGNGLRSLLQAVGYQTVYLSYWNTLLFPLMVITRKLLPANRAATSDVKLYPPVLDILCRVVTGIETGLLRIGLRMPFGGSVIAVAVKRDAAHG